MEIARSRTTKVPHTGSRSIATPATDVGPAVGGAPRIPSSTPSTIRQKARATIAINTSSRTYRSITGDASLWGGGRRSSGMSRAQAVERALCRLPFGSLRRDLQHLLPGLFRAVEILLAEGAHEAEIQPGLGVFRVRLDRSLELLERAIGLVRVVVRHRQLGAHPDVVR